MARATHRTRSNACAGRPRRAACRPAPHPSLSVAGLGRREARLRLLKKLVQFQVGQLREWLFARAGALRRVARDSNFTIAPGSASEEQSEFILIVLCDEAGRIH